jgi:hypothetical protein
MRLRRHWLLVLVIELAALGCSNDLPRASNIDHMRVLGAVTEVHGDTQRATPKPGESADLTWSVVFPDPNQDETSQLASVFLTCTAPTTYEGTPVCQELIDIAQGGDISQVVADLRGDNRPDCGKNPDRVYHIGPFTIACVTQTPHLTVDVADDFSAAAKFIEGVVCRNGVPSIDPTDPSGLKCIPNDGVAAKDVESIAVYGNVTVQHQDEDQNDNPSLDAAKFSLHNPPLLWQAPSDENAAELDDDNCLQESQARRVMNSDGNVELLTIGYDADQREQVDGKPEQLEFSAYTTLGELERRFTVFTPEAQPPLKSTLTWKLDEGQRAALNGKSKRVRFYFSVIDGRGGFAVTSRDLCINRQ